MILDEIVKETEGRLRELKDEGYYGKIHEMAKTIPQRNGKAFYERLRAPGLSFICELKQASPSKGQIVEDFPFEEIAREYEQGGAAAISCLTEPRWFKGDIDYLRRTAEAVETPVLRKDFIIDEVQIEEAAVNGASAILLIAAILNDNEIRTFMKRAEDFGMAVLTEAHDEKEVRRLLSLKAPVIGVNNRNLKDFTIDLENAERLGKLIPDDVIFVVESGMKSPEAIARMRNAGADAVLIGEYLMKSDNRIELLKKLIKDNQ